MSDASKLLARPATVSPEPLAAGEGPGPGSRVHDDDRVMRDDSSDGSDIAGIEELETSSSDDDVPVAKRARPQAQPSES